MEYISSEHIEKINDFDFPIKVKFIKIIKDDLRPKKHQRPDILHIELNNNKVIYFQSQFLELYHVIQQRIKDLSNILK